MLKCFLWIAEERKGALFYLEKKENNMIKIPSLKKLKANSISFCKRALFLSSGKPKGGMALEGSLALPIFLFIMMTIMLSLEAVRFQSNVQEALYQTGNKRAYEEYQVQYLGGERSDAHGQIKEYLNSQLYPYLCVAGGESGVTVQDLSTADGNGRVEIWAEYKIKSFIEWIPIGQIRIKERFVSHPWIGYNNVENLDTAEEETYVYVTKTGSKYHLSDHCTYLRVQLRAVNYDKISSLRNELGGKYHACQRCRPVKGGMVYITGEGSSYHGKADCSALKRTVYMIPLSEANSYGACSKCAG